MIIIHVVNKLPRHVGDALAARLSVMPAAVITGARAFRAEYGENRPRRPAAAWWKHA
jgi:hypothetical protein